MYDQPDEGSLNDNTYLRKKRGSSRDIVTEAVMLGPEKIGAKNWGDQGNASSI